MSICLSVSLKRFGGKRDFLGYYSRYIYKMYVKIPQTNKHLFYHYFVRLSVGNSFPSYGRTSPYLSKINVSISLFYLFNYV